jgi:hypothetical protein
MAHSLRCKRGTSFKNPRHYRTCSTCLIPSAYYGSGMTGVVLCQYELSEGISIL